MKSNIFLMTSPGCATTFKTYTSDCWTPLEPHQIKMHGYIGHSILLLPPVAVPRDSQQ